MAAGEERRKNALILSRVRKVQRALNAEVWLNAAVAPAWVAATALALTRLFLRGHLVWVAAALALFGAVAWVARARRRLVPLEHAAVLADRSGSLGGLLLTRLEVSVGEWELEVNERVRQIKAPKVKRARSLAALSMAALFLAVALWVPLPPPAVLRVNAAAASKVAEVEAKADALAREDRLDEATEAELARLREELADNRFDSADWEAADGVEASLEKQAAQAAADLSRAAEAAKAMEDALASSQTSDGAAREQEELERALQSLSGAEGKSGADALKDALAGNGGDSADKQGDGEKQGGEQGADGKQGGDKQGGDKQGGDKQGGDGQAQNAQGQRGAGAKNPTAGQVSSLRKALENRQKQLANAYGQQQSQGGLRQASRGSIGQGQSGQSRTGEGEGEGQGQSGKEGGEGHASRNLNGAPVHGGGEGELVFGDQARMDPERLKFEPLPPGQGGDAEELWGLRAADPRVREGPASGAASGAAAAGEQAPGFKEGPLLPRNRELLKRYFDSPR